MKGTSPSRTSRMAAAGIRPVLVDPLDLRPEVDCETVRSLVDVAALIARPA